MFPIPTNIDNVTYNSFGMTELEQELISDILAERDVELNHVVKNDDGRKITLDYLIHCDGDYIIRINISRIDLAQIPELLSMLKEETIFWQDFMPRDKLWYSDWSYLTCISADHSHKMITFE